jgi:hypothetical protein
MADIHLLHFTTGAPDIDIVVNDASTLNHRGTHLSKYGSSRLVAAWETSASAFDFSTSTADRKFYLQTRDAVSGEAEGAPFQVSVEGNRYYEFRDFPDGSVAYPAPGSSNTKIKIMRVLPCSW